MQKCGQLVAYIRTSLTKCVQVEADIQASSTTELMSIEVGGRGKCEELCAIDGTTESQKKRQTAMTVDSGAGESVCGPQDAPEYEVQPSQE